MKLSSGSVFAFPPSALTRQIRQRKLPLQDRSRATTDAILEATLQVLLRDGYATLTTTRVAERAGVSVGTIYQYFPDKGSLVTALKVRYVTTMVGAVHAAASAAVGAPVEEALRRTLSALIAVKRDNRALTVALLEPMAEARGSEMRRGLSVTFVEILAPMLRAAGVLDAERRASLLSAAIEGAVSTAVLESPQWLEEDWFLEDLVALAVGYVGAGGERAGSRRPAGRASS